MLCAKAIELELAGDIRRNDHSGNDRKREHDAQLGLVDQGLQDEAMQEPRDRDEQHRPDDREQNTYTDEKIAHVR